MTPDEQETVVSAFVERSQAIGTGSALEEIVEQAEDRALEAAARVFAAHPGTWTHHEVSALLRGMRGRR